MINWLKSIPQKWFLVGILVLALVGCLLGIYLFQNDYFEKMANKNNSIKPAPPVQKKVGQGVISEEKLNKLVESLTLEEKIGQLFIIGIADKELSPELRKFLTDCHIGGILLQPGSMTSLEQTRNLTSNLQKQFSYREIPLFIAVNQEGGVVNTLPPGATVFPGNMAIGATKSTEYAYRFGRVTGRELGGLGINLNLAPVLDLATNKTSPMAELRSFSEDSEVTALLGVRYLVGLQSTGIAAAAKYFPGLGEALENPQKSLPIISLDLNELESRELVPFAEAVKNNAAAIVVGHALFPQIDPRNSASLSDKFIQDILRSNRNLGYQGLIITDDLNNKAIAESLGTAPAAVQAIRSGADMIIIGNNLAAQTNAYKALLNGVKSGEIKESQINSAVKRILRAKFRYGITYPSKEAELYRDIAVAAHTRRAARVGQEAITIVKNEEKALPLPEKSKILLLIPDTLPYNGNPQYLAQLLKKYYPKLVSEKLVNYNTPEEKNVLLAKVSNYPVVVIATYNAGPRQGALVKDILALPDKKVIVVALGNPYDIELFPEIKTYLVTYGYRNVSLEGLTRVLAGHDQGKHGTLPVTLKVH